MPPNLPIFKSPGRRKFRSRDRVARSAAKSRPDSPHSLLMETFRKLISKKLSSLLIERGYEVSEFLAIFQRKTDGCEVTGQTVRNWLAGTSTPRLYLFPLIADVFGCADYRELLPSPAELLREFSSGAGDALATKIAKDKA